MKKELTISFLIVVILVVLGSFFIFQEYVQEEYVQELSQEQILEVVKPEVQAYCQDLGDMVIASHCVICGGSYSGELENKNYVYVEDFEEGGYGGYKYMIEDKGEYYLVTFQLHMIAGRNDRPAGNHNLIFRVDKEGNILESDIPEVSECV